MYLPHVYLDLTTDGTPGWVDITSDVLARPGIRWNYGILSNDVDERIAGSGVLSLVLNNRTGQYSPDNASCRAGFGMSNRIKIAYEGDLLDSNYEILWVSLQETYGSDVTAYATNFGYDSDLFRAHDVYATDLGYDSNGFIWATNNGYTSDNNWRSSDPATYCSDDGYDSNGFTWTYATDNGYTSDNGWRSSDAATYCTDSGFDSNGFTWTYATDSGFGSDGVWEVNEYIVFATDFYGGGLFDSNGQGTSDWNSNAIATDGGFTTNTSGEVFLSGTDSGYGSDGLVWATDYGYGDDLDRHATDLWSVDSDEIESTNALGMGSDWYNSSNFVDYFDVVWETYYVFQTSDYWAVSSDLPAHLGWTSNIYASDYGAQASDVPDYDVATDLVAASDTIWTNSSDLPAACGWASETWSTDLTVYTQLAGVATDVLFGDTPTSTLLYGESFRNTSDTFRLSQITAWGVMYPTTVSEAGTYNIFVYAHSGTYGATDSSRGAQLAVSVNVLGTDTLTTNFSYWTFGFTGANQISLTSNVPYIWEMYVNAPGTDGINIQGTGTNAYPGIAFLNAATRTTSTESGGKDYFFKVEGYKYLTTTNAFELASDFATDGITASNVGVSSNIDKIWGGDNDATDFVDVLESTDVTFLYASNFGLATNVGGGIRYGSDVTSSNILDLFAVATDAGYDSDGFVYAINNYYSTSYTLYATDNGFDSNGVSVSPATYCTNSGFDSDGFTWTYASDAGYNTDLGRLVATYCTDDGYDSDGFTWTYATDNSYLSDGKQYATDYSATSDVLDSDGFDWSWSTDAGWSSDGTDYGSDNYADGMILGYYQDTDASFIGYTNFSLADGLYHPLSTDRTPSGIYYRYTSDGGTSNTAIYKGGDFSLNLWFQVADNETWVFGTDGGVSSDTTYVELFDFDSFYGTDELRVNLSAHSTDTIRSIEAAVTVGTDTLLTKFPVGTSTDWFHVVVSVDPGTSISVYLDGALLGNSSCPNYSGTDFDQEILTCYSQAVPCFLGSLGHLGIFNRALTAEEVAAITTRNEFQKDVLYTLSSGPPDFYWQLGATVASTAITLEDGVNTSNADEFTKFVGDLTNIQPNPDIAGPKTVEISAHDWMGKAGQYPIGPVPVQNEQLSGTVIRAILDYSDIWPQDSEIDVGANSFVYSVDESNAGTLMMGELNRIARSEPGYIYTRGGATSDGDRGETFVFDDRTARQVLPSAVMSLSDTNSSDYMTKLSVVQSLPKIYNLVRITAHPQSIDAADEVIYALDTDSIPEIPPNGTFYMYAEYLDVDLAYEVIGAIDVKAPVRNVDYEVHTGTAGGSDVTEDVRETILVTSSDNLIGYWTLLNTETIALRDELQPAGDAAQSNAPRASGSLGVTGVSTFIGSEKTYLKPPTKISTGIKSTR